jgi:hypothetical protein
VVFVIVAQKIAPGKTTGAVTEERKMTLARAAGGRAGTFSLQDRKYIAEALAPILTVAGENLEGQPD